MRRKGTKYEKVEALPAGALPVSKYATNNNMATAYVHVKYDRHNSGYTTPQGKFRKAPDPGYKIVDYQGMNYVVISED